MTIHDWTLLTSFIRVVNKVVKDFGGEFEGTSWYGTHRFAIDEFIHPGENTLEVTVSTVLANDMKAKSLQSTQERWAWWYNEIAMGLEGPVRFLSQ